MTVAGMAGRIFVALCIAALSAALFVIAVDSPPTTHELDKDIGDLQTRIKEAKIESEKFDGGLIKALIEIRIEILASTEAMLAAKRKSIMRHINLSFEIDGREYKPTNSVEEIQKEIAAAESRASLARAEAQKYSGGLLQALQISKLATEELSVSQLNSAYYCAKYGLPSIGIFASRANAKQKAPDPGKIVKDKDAL